MIARDIMTRNVRSVAPSTSLRDVAKVMISRRISAVPVIDRRAQVLGIVSEGDFLQRRAWWLAFFAGEGSPARELANGRKLQAQDVMTAPVISVAEQTGVGEIIDILERCKIKRVPVLRGGKLVGIVSRRDIVRGLRNGTKGTRLLARNLTVRSDGK